MSHSHEAEEHQMQTPADTPLPAQRGDRRHEAPESRWRDERGPGWHHDLGYLLQDVLHGHRYDYRAKGSKPDDPGWHACTCGWEGYWSSFNPHVADHLRAAALDPAGYRAVLDERARARIAAAGFGDEDD